MRSDKKIYWTDTFTINGLTFSMKWTLSSMFVLTSNPIEWDWVKVGKKKYIFTEEPRKKNDILIWCNLEITGNNFLEKVSPLVKWTMTKTIVITKRLFRKDIEQEYNRYTFTTKEKLTWDFCDTDNFVSSNY